MHPLYIQPDLGGPDPVWVCEETGDAVAPLGGPLTASGPAQLSVPTWSHMVYRSAR